MSSPDLTRCPACGITFLGRAAFDDHRVPWPNGWIGFHCRPPADIGLTMIRQVETGTAVWVRGADLQTWIGA
jgi:hypothetical protein